MATMAYEFVRVAKTPTLKKKENERQMWVAHTLACKEISFSYSLYRGELKLTRQSFRIVRVLPWCEKDSADQMVPREKKVKKGRMNN